jgi:predicted metal-dependent HD superfamily phosphohydrolase
VPFEARWSETWRLLALETPPSPILQQLLARYAEPQRAYHTSQHLNECFAIFDELRAGMLHSGEVACAIWFHDAVYDPRRADNEERSADWALEVLSATGAPADVIASVRQLILSTTHTAEPVGLDQSILTDIDLAILGAPAERFAEYESQIRLEHSWVPAFVYRRERAHVLRGFLERPRIYRTELLHGRLEERARRNLGRALTEGGE